MIERDIIALDRGSARTVDRDGHLHIDDSPISKAVINEYRGGEIPKGNALGLEPDRRYRLLRDPKELEKAAPTFEGKPLHIVHRVQNADGHDREVVVGSIDGLRWEAPYLRAKLHVWDADGIDGIEDDSRRQLSCGYHYDADMTPGTYEGEPYDGVMRNIVGNHVALVEKGRAGSDVVVGDEALPPHRLFNIEESVMAMSRKALALQSAIAVWLPDKLAADQKLPDLTPVIAGVTRKNFKSGKGAITDRLKIALKGMKMAKDASLADMHGLLDRLDGVGEEGEDEREVEETNNAARDAGGMAEKICAMLEGKVTPEMLEKIRAMGSAEDEMEDMPTEDEMEGKSPEERAKMMREARDKKARDKAAADKAARDRAARDSETEAEKKAREDKEKREAEDKAAKDRKAMDSAIQAASVKTRAETIALMRSIADAEKFVQPWVGDVLAQDSAEDVYKMALDSLGVKTNGIHPSAYRALLEARPKPGDATVPVRMALDSGAVGDIAKRIPKFGRLLHSSM